MVAEEQLARTPSLTALMKIVPIVFPVLPPPIAPRRSGALLVPSCRGGAQFTLETD